MKILHVINSLEGGGAEALLYRMATWPSEDEHFVVCLGPTEPYGSKLESRGICVVVLSLSCFIKSQSAILRELKGIAKWDPDVVQGWMYRGNILGGLIGKWLGVPVTWGLHCSTFDQMGLATRLVVQLSIWLSDYLPDFVISCSHRATELHVEAGYPENKTTTVVNGYDTSTYFRQDDQRNLIRTELGLQPHTFLVGSVARWHPQKDLPNFLRALSALEGLGLKDWVCIWTGAGLDIHNDEAVTAIAGFGLADRVKLLGFRTDVPGVMSALDLLVLPSAFGEAFPNVVAEAMSCETPCLVTDVGDAAYMVDSTGWVVPPRDPEALAATLLDIETKFRNDYEGWRELGRLARKRVVENFTFERMYQGYKNVWQSLMEKDC